MISLTTFEQLFPTSSPQNIERLGWVLVHSLWEFALVAVMAGLIVRRMRHGSAATRYGVLVMAIIATVVVPIATWNFLPYDQFDDSPNLKSSSIQHAPQAQFGSEFARSQHENRPLAESGPSDPADRSAAHVTTGISRKPSTRDEPAMKSAAVAWLERAREVMRPCLMWIVMGWIVGVALCSLRPVLGWLMLRRLRRTGVSAVSEEIQTSIHRIAQRLSLRYVVDVVQSTLVQVPVVVGYLRPVILLPVSLLTTIPPSQLEAILAHELAHVRRHDFLVNLLQTLIETVFFYHPAIWWLSRQIRIEREYCCDDLVVGLLGNQFEYSRALLAVAERGERSHVLALAATDGVLLSRVQRILNISSSRRASHSPMALLGLATFGLAVALTMGWKLAAMDDDTNSVETTSAPLASSKRKQADDGKDALPAKEESRQQSLRDREIRAEQQPARRVAPLETVVGKVVASNEEPIAGVEILAFEGGTQLEQKFVSDAQGQFEVPKAWRRSDHYLTLVAHDKNERLGWFDFFFHAHSDNGQKSNDGSFRMVLLPMSRTVRGRVTDDGGNPLANIQLEVQYLQHAVNFAAVHWRYQKIDEQPIVRGAITGSDGRFELKLPANTFAWLGTNSPDFVGRRIQVPKEIAELADTKLPPAAKVAGRVVDSRTGRPMAAVSIAAQSVETDMDTGGWGEAKTDANGDYVIGGLPAGEFNILLLKTSFKTLTAPAATVKLNTGLTQSVDFSLIVGRRLTGKVMSVETNAPLAGCTVNCSGPSRPGAAVISTETDSNGEFEFFVPPGKNHVYIGENRETVPEQSADVDVLANQDPGSIRLNAGRKMESPSMKVFVGPPLDRKVSIALVNVPLKDALERLSKAAAVNIEFDEEIASMKMPVTLQHESILVSDALKQILKQFKGLEFSVHDDGRISVKKSAAEK